MKLRAAGRTDKGLLPSHNEDRFLARHDLGLYAVADGIGGLEAGEVASSAACGVLEAEIARAAACEPALRDQALETAVARCNEAVLALGEGRDDRRGIGSTLVVLWFQGDRALFASVGDSRLYLLRGGSLRQLTRDAKAGRFRLAASLGQAEDLRPQMGMVRLKGGDRFLLCTDGLHAVVPEEQIARILDDEADCARCSERLVRAANDAGGQDNVTVVVADVVEPDAPRSWQFSRLRLDATSPWPKVARLVAAALASAAVALGVGLSIAAWASRPTGVPPPAAVPAPVALMVSEANERAAAHDMAGTKAALEGLVRAAIRERAVVKRQDLRLSPQVAALLDEAAQAVWDELYAPARKEIESIAGTPAHRYVRRELAVTQERVALVRRQFFSGDYRHVAETFATLAEEVGTIVRRGWREFRQERRALGRELEAVRERGKGYPPGNPIRRSLERLVAEAARALEMGDLPAARRSIERANGVLRGEVEPR